MFQRKCCRGQLPKTMRAGARQSTSLLPTLLVFHARHGGRPRMEYRRACRCCRLVASATSRIATNNVVGRILLVLGAVEVVSDNDHGRSSVRNGRTRALGVDSPADFSFRFSNSRAGEHSQGTAASGCGYHRLAPMSPCLDTTGERAHLRWGDGSFLIFFFIFPFLNCVTCLCPFCCPFRLVEVFLFSRDIITPRWPVVCGAEDIIMDQWTGYCKTSSWISNPYAFVL